MESIVWKEEVDDEAELDIVCNIFEKSLIRVLSLPVHRSLSKMQNSVL